MIITNIATEFPSRTYIYLRTMRSVVGSNPTQGRFFSFEKEKAVLSVYPLCHVCIQQVL